MVTHEIGDSICDMHYGLPTKDYAGNEIKVISHIEIECENSTDLLRKLLNGVGFENGSSYTNKIAVVVDWIQLGWTCAYSYDGNHFGMFDFEIIEKE